MKCIFCPEEELLIDLDFESSKVQSCPNCKTNFFFNEDGQLKIWYFIVLYKEYNYYITWIENNLEISAVTADIDKLISGQHSRKVLTSISNQKIDQGTITPHNIMRKMPLILTFL